MPNAPRRAAPTTGPPLLLVRGQREGHISRWRGEPRLRPRWIVGRKLGLAASLDDAPCVSCVNAEILRSGSGDRVLDDRSSHNGALLNLKPLPRGGEGPSRTAPW